MKSKQILLRGLFAQFIVGILGVFFMDITLFLSSPLNWYLAINSLARMLVGLFVVYLFIKIKDKLKASHVMLFIFLLIFVGTVVLFPIVALHLLSWEWPNVILIITVAAVVIFGVISLLWSFAELKHQPL